MAVAQVLLGETPAELGRIEASEAATEVMFQVAKVQSKYWSSIDVKSCEPPEVDIEDELVRISIPGEYFDRPVGNWDDLIMIA